MLSIDSLGHYRAPLVLQSSRDPQWQNPLIDQSLQWHSGWCQPYGVRGITPRFGLFALFGLTEIYLLLIRRRKLLGAHVFASRGSRRFRGCLELHGSQIRVLRRSECSGVEASSFLTSSSRIAGRWSALEPQGPLLSRQLGPSQVSRRA